MNSRKLGEEELSVLECPRCAGLWLGDAALEILLDRSRQRTESSGSGHHVPPKPGAAAPNNAVIYRPCPECTKRMSPRNWGKTSGVIVDGCKGHGVWFDHDELEALLQWVRGGGEIRSQEERAREEREAEKRKRLEPVLVGTHLEESEPLSVSGGSILDALTKLAGWLAR